MFSHVPAGAHPLDFGALAFPGAHGLSSHHGPGHGHAAHPHMQMDIAETPQDFRISADLPGFKKVCFVCMFMHRRARGSPPFVSLDNLNR